MTLGERHMVAELAGGRIACVCGWAVVRADFGGAHLAHCMHMIRVAQGRDADRLPVAKPAAA